MRLINWYCHTGLPTVQREDSSWTYSLLKGGGATIDTLLEMHIHTTLTSPPQIHPPPLQQSCALTLSRGAIPALTLSAGEQLLTAVAVEGKLVVSLTRSTETGLLKQAPSLHLLQPLVLFLFFVLRYIERERRRWRECESEKEHGKAGEYRREVTD